MVRNPSISYTGDSTSQTKPANSSYSPYICMYVRARDHRTHTIVKTTLYSRRQDSRHSRERMNHSTRTANSKEKNESSSDHSRLASLLSASRLPSSLDFSSRSMVASSCSSASRASVAAVALACRSANWSRKDSDNDCCFGAAVP